jgi:hypothetical protein
LLVALIPGLLMAATFGLERLETGLNRDTVSATDVAKFLDQAKAVEVGTLARDGMGPALDRLNRRLHDQESWHDRRTQRASGAGLPTRVHVQPRVNTEFQRTPHAYRV